jgi:hypothetical protein
MLSWLFILWTAYQTCKKCYAEWREYQIISNSWGTWISPVESPHLDTKDSCCRSISTNLQPAVLDASFNKAALNLKSSKIQLISSPKMWLFLQRETAVTRPRFSLSLPASFGWAQIHLVAWNANLQFRQAANQGPGQSHQGNTSDS